MQISMKPRARVLLFISLTALIFLAVFAPALVHAQAPAAVLEAPVPISGFPIVGPLLGAIAGGAGRIVVGLFDTALAIVVTTTGGGLLFLAGFFFDWMATFSLLGTIYQSGQGSIVYAGWTIFRDLANILFIFILIYIGIATILRLASAQTYQLLARVIVIAILINFSLVITRVVIDASNILALTFYDAFPPRNDFTNFTSGVLSGLGNTKSLSWPFIKSSGVFRFFESSLFDGWLAQRTTGFGIGSAVAETAVYNISELVVLLIASFVLFAAGILFAIRTVILMMLMILSPAAFAMYILPGTQGYAKEWWSTLLKQAFFAPIFLALYYVTARIFGALFQSINITNTATNFYGSIGTIIINFSIVTIFLVSTLIISQKLGAYGASTLIKRGKKLGNRGIGFAARNTIGRVAYALRESDRFREFAGRNPRLASLALQPIAYTAKAPFGGGKGGFEGSVKSSAGRGADILELLETDAKGRQYSTTSETGGGILKGYYGKDVTKGGKNVMVSKQVWGAASEIKRQQSRWKRMLIGGERVDRETMRAYTKKKGKSSLEEAAEEAGKAASQSQTGGDNTTP